MVCHVHFFCMISRYYIKSDIIHGMIEPVSFYTFFAAK